MKNTPLTLAMAGLTVSIRSNLNLLFLRDKRFQSFRSTAANPDICWGFQTIGPNSLTLPPIDPENNPLLARTVRLGAFSPLLGSPQVQTHLQQALDHSEWLTVEMQQNALTILDFMTNRADFFISAESSAEQKHHTIGPALLALFMPHFSAMLLHASAIVRNGKSAVFLAPDEGGKTTAVRLSPDGAILSDDQVLIRQTSSGFQASGTPWGLYSNSKLQSQLGGLFLLEKSGNFALNPLPPTELSRYIWETHKNQLAILPAPLQTKAQEITVAISNSAPTWKLSFSKDAIDWKMIDKAMAGC
jgi:hypothetical protein